MLLYHCFPRRYSGDPDRALEQLKIMMEFGLLLTPEVLDIGQMQTNKCVWLQESKIQLECASFTLVDRRELWSPKYKAKGVTLEKQQSHFDLFGEFAIGIDPADARNLGASPVYYFYTDKGDEDNGINIPYLVLLCLLELRTLAISLARVEARAMPNDNDIYSTRLLNMLGYVLSSEDELEDRVQSISKEEARAAISLLTQKRTPAWNMVDRISIILNFFQGTDYPGRENNLEYYRQREWRITRFFGPGLGFYRLGARSRLDGQAQLPEEYQMQLKEQLLALDEEYFTTNRFDSCSILYSFNKQPFFRYVKEIVVPRKRKLRRILMESLETFGYRYKVETVSDRYVFVQV